MPRLSYLLSAMDDGRRNLCSIPFTATHGWLKWANAGSEEPILARVNTRRHCHDGLLLFLPVLESVERSPCKCLY